MCVISSTYNGCKLGCDIFRSNISIIIINVFDGKLDLILLKTNKIIVLFHKLTYIRNRFFLIPLHIEIPYMYSIT